MELKQWNQALPTTVDVQDRPNHQGACEEGKRLIELDTHPSGYFIAALESTMRQKSALHSSEVALIHGPKS